MGFNYTNFNYPAPGLNSVGEYMASGLPWVTASSATTSSFQINFPFVTNELMITNSGSNPLRVGFTQNGVNGSNYFLVLPGTDAEIDVRIKTLYVRAHTGSVDYSVYAGLTQIPARSMPVLTGSDLAATYNPATTASLYGYATGLG